MVALLVLVVALPGSVVALLLWRITNPPPSQNGASRSATPGIMQTSAQNSPPLLAYQIAPSYLSVLITSPLGLPRHYTK